ncbi:3-dehydroquinate synthase [Kineosporia sp. NBRC 101731]|uniref:3-dehydroquinate synthase n=1 Tax=Kineosporia sp. NBRC 101731 TaxID=3032199 RepID=UPI0024A53ADF|nr:3-dehydroquinate synthase [Kineosporia sp. NBRC 101731]GLY30593.1 3-dehydroquinate synthase [Kineosporia sp. NBRC 101731]
MTDTATKITVGRDEVYEVTIGSGVLADLPAALGPQVTRVAIVHPRTLRALGRTVNQQLTDAGLRPLLIEVPDGEAAKTAETLTMCWALLGQAGFTRSDAVVGLGGGAVTDLAGFVAASWLRGVAVVQVPTTLLGMVDAAVGGKTGINTAEGKNLVGAFHPPRAVICDLDALRTLPHADLVAGLAEVVKCGFIADPAILDLVERDPAAATSWDSDVLRELVERAIAVKAKVVTNDLKESGEREFLNYGHTFAHGVEQVEQYTWRHGEAVAVGMMYVARLGELAGRTPPELVARHSAALASLGLPRTYRGDRWPALVTAMGRDKKNRGDLMRFIVLDGLAAPGRLEGPEPALLEEAYRLISE